MSASPILLRYRNREIGEPELAQIRALASEPGLVRQELSRRLCRLWEWKQTNGSYAEYACRDLLLRLQTRGLVTLPERVIGKRTRKTHPALPVELIPVAWLAVNGPQELRGLEVRPTSAEERSGVRVYLERYHYLGYQPPIGEHLFHAAFLKGELVALVGWAAAAAHAPLRERHIGWDEGQRRHRLHLVTNNVRFLVMPWVRVPHLASKVLALSLRRLSRDWTAAHGHPVHLAETFVDTARFRGTCYRAANWKYLGQTAGRAKQGNQFLHTANPKALFVYELHRRARQKLLEVDPRAGGDA